MGWEEEQSEQREYHGDPMTSVAQIAERGLNESACKTQNWKEDKKGGSLQRTVQSAFEVKDDTLIPHL